MKNDILGKIPYNSVVGFILILMGGGLMAFTSFKGWQKIDRLFNDYFFPVNELPYAKFIALTISIAVIILSVVILAYSALVTSATKGKILRSENFLMGGKNSAILFITLCYMASFVWLIVALILMVPNLMWIIIMRICLYGTGDRWFPPNYDFIMPKQVDVFIPPKSYYDNSKVIDPLSHYDQLLEQKFSFNLSNYGIFVDLDKINANYGYKTSIVDDSTFLRFCDDSYNTGVYCGCSLAGTVLVLCGLAILTPALSSFYTKLKLSKELTKYKTTAGLLKANNQGN